MGATSARAVSTGSVKVKRQPDTVSPLYRFCALIRPRCDSTMVRHRLNPMPRPSTLVEKNASYKRAITSSCRPGPVSVTLNSITPPSSGVWRGTTRSSMLRRDGGKRALSIASAAFFSRLSTTCSIRIGSTISVGSRCATYEWIVTLRRRSSMPARSTASSTIVRACAGCRCGSLRFTNARMRWMIWPARCAWRAVFCSASTRSSFRWRRSARARPCRCSSW